MSLPQRGPGRSSDNTPKIISEIYGRIRQLVFNASGEPVKVLAEADGTARSQLVLWNYAGAAQIRAAGEPTTGEAHVLLHGKDAGGTVDELLTNASKALVVDISNSPTARKVLGQLNPSAATETVLYTVSASTEAEITLLSVANRSATASLDFRIGLSVGGGALADTDYIVYDITLPPKNAYVHAAPIYLAATDEIRIESTNATASFTATGLEYAT